MIGAAACQGPLRVADLANYSETLLGWTTKSGKATRVDAPEISLLDVKMRAAPSLLRNDLSAVPGAVYRLDSRGSANLL